jgi:hypothetical protein
VCFPFATNCSFLYVFSSLSPVKFMSIYLKEKKNIGKTGGRKSDYTYGKP